MKKNDLFSLKITDMGVDGEGIGKYDGMTFFVKDALIGDEIRARATKLKKHYGYARVVDTLLVYTISSSNYTGGAHGMYSINCHNYSIAGGYELALSDLFDAARQEALIGLIRNKLYEQFGVTGDEGLVAQGFFPEYISTTENFEVTEDGITFYYNPYDIGCYALGGVEVHITREEMQGL